MSYVIGSSCVGCKDTHCVKVCPVDCFYEGPNMLYIDPNECIDCALCEPECPVNAIYADDEVPANQIDFIEINEKGAEVYQNKRIVETKEPMASESPYSVDEAIKIAKADLL